MRQFTDDDLTELRVRFSAAADASEQLAVGDVARLVADLAQALASERVTRRLAEQHADVGIELLDSARCSHADPALRRSWGQRRKNLRTAVEARRP